MNESTLNGATLNGAPADSVQRVALASVARAVGVAQYRVAARAAFSPTAAATATLAGRVLRPVSIQASAQADATVTYRPRKRGPVSLRNSAEIVARYTVFERVYARQPTAFSGTAQSLINSITVARGIVGPTAQARIGVTGFVVPREEIRTPIWGVGTGAVAANARIERRVPLAMTSRALIAARQSSPNKYNVPVSVTSRALIVALQSSRMYIEGSASAVAAAAVSIDPTVFTSLPYDENAPDERTMLLSADGRELMVV